MWLVDVVRHTVPYNIHQLHVQQPSTYEKPEAASSVLGSWWWAVCRPKHVELHINKEWSFDTSLHLVGFFFMNCTMMHGSTNIKSEWMSVQIHVQPTNGVGLEKVICLISKSQLSMARCKTYPSSLFAVLIGHNPCNDPIKLTNFPLQITSAPTSIKFGQPEDGGSTFPWSTRTNLLSYTVQLSPITLRNLHQVRLKTWIYFCH